MHTHSIFVMAAVLATPYGIAQDAPPKKTHEAGSAPTRRFSGPVAEDIIVHAPKLMPETCQQLPRPDDAEKTDGYRNVKLEFHVSATGEVMDIGVFRTSGDPALDRAAVRGLRTCKFQPGTMNGQAIDAVTLVNYVWKYGNKPNAISQ
jgi:TonB family protein